MYSWQINSFSEFNELIDLTLAGVYSDHIATISEGNQVNAFNVQTQCTNCDEIFEKKDFDEHCCQYDSEKKFIFSKYWEQHLFLESDTMNILRENRKQIGDILQQCKENANNSVHTCFVCQRTYVHASGLERHMENHRMEHQSNQENVMVKSIAAAATVKMVNSFDAQQSVQMLKCLVCGQIFMSSKMCFKHLKLVHPEFGFNCDDDDDENDLRIESISDTSMFEQVTTDLVLKCEYCDGLFMEMQTLYQHELNHDVNIGYECSNCEVASRNLRFILNHRNNECPTDPNITKTDTKVYFVCSTCDDMFASLTQLYEHRYATKHFKALCNRQTKCQEYFCEKCGQIFSVLETLLEHAENGHKKGKSYALVSDVATRPYLCEVCGKGYTQSSHLYQHLRFHKGIKPFECSFADCSRRFTIRPDLNDHIRKCHTGERPYKCTENNCTKTFLTGSVYYQHRLIHRNERRYGCSALGCGKRFHRSDALKNHERIHTGEKPYSCSVCLKKFRQKGDRDKHFRSRHQNSFKLSPINEDQRNNSIGKQTRLR